MFWIAVILLVIGFLFLIGFLNYKMKKTNITDFKKYVYDLCLNYDKRNNILSKTDENSAFFWCYEKLPSEKDLLKINSIELELTEFFNKKIIHKLYFNSETKNKETNTNNKPGLYC